MNRKHLLSPAATKIFVAPLLLWAPVGAGVPKEIIPEKVSQELAALDERFHKELYSECRQGNCFAKGCNYVAHKTVSKRGDVALPGIYTGRDLTTGGEPQSYLTAARCHYSFEGILDKAIIADFDKRLAQKLSVGFLRVRITSQELPPQHRELLATPEALAGQAPQQDMAEQMAKDAWQRLAPALPWLAGLIAATGCFLLGLWAFRRLGQESVEEQILAQQMRQQAEQEAQEQNAKDEERRLEKQRQAELERRLADYEDDPSLMKRIAHHWLAAGKFQELGMAVRRFGSRGHALLGDELELHAKREAFADFYRDQQSHLPPAESDSFVAALDDCAAELCGLGQDPMEVFKNFTRSYSAADLAEMIEMMPTPIAGLTLAYVPPKQLAAVTKALSTESTEVVKALVVHLLKDNRMGRNLYAAAKDWLLALQDDKTPLTDSAVLESCHGGVEFDVSLPLSHLLATLPSAERQRLFSEAKHAHRGTLPRSATAVCYPELLAALPADVRNNILLEQDLDSLRVWYQQLDRGELKQRILAKAPATVVASLNSGSTRDMLDVEEESHYREAVMGLSQSISKRINRHELAADILV